MADASVDGTPNEADPGGPDIGLFEAIYTTRAMRRLHRDPVPTELLARLVEAATMAPTDAFTQRWRFLVVTDPAVIAEIGRRYTEAFERVREVTEASMSSENFRSVAALGGRFAEAPAIIFVGGIGSPQGKHHGRAFLNFHGGLYPAVQNLLLAARAHGLGATLTTLVISYAEDSVKSLLGIPDEVDLVAAIPIGWPKGRIGRPARQRIDTVCHLNHWGEPIEPPTDGSLLHPNVPAPPAPALELRGARNV